MRFVPCCTVTVITTSREAERGSAGMTLVSRKRQKSGSTSNEARGARQPTSVVLKLGAPNQCSVVPLGRRGSCRAGGISGVPGSSVQRELRPPSIAVNTSGNAVCSCAQDFAFIQKSAPPEKMLFVVGTGFHRYPAAGILTNCVASRRAAAFPAGAAHVVAFRIPQPRHRSRNADCGTGQRRSTAAG